MTIERVHASRASSSSAVRLFYGAVLLDVAGQSSFFNAPVDYVGNTVQALDMSTPEGLATGCRTCTSVSRPKATRSSIEARPRTASCATRGRCGSRSICRYRARELEPDERRERGPLPSELLHERQGAAEWRRP